jgi:hypothetical protein
MALSASGPRAASKYFSIFMTMCPHLRTSNLSAFPTNPSPPPPPRSFGRGISVITFVSSFDTLWRSTSWKWGSAAKTNSLSSQRTESYTTPSSQSLYRLRYQPAIRLTVIYTAFFDITSSWRYVPILATRGRSLLTYHSLPIHWEIILECSWSLYCSHIHTGVFIFQTFVYKPKSWDYVCFELQTYPTCRTSTPNCKNINLNCYGLLCSNPEA